MVDSLAAELSKPRAMGGAKQIPGFVSSGTATAGHNAGAQGAGRRNADPTGFPVEQRWRPLAATQRLEGESFTHASPGLFLIELSLAPLRTDDSLADWQADPAQDQINSAAWLHVPPDASGYQLQHQQQQRPPAPDRGQVNHVFATLPTPATSSLPGHLRPDSATSVHTSAFNAQDLIALQQQQPQPQNFHLGSRLHSPHSSGRQISPGHLTGSVALTLPAAPATPAAPLPTYASRFPTTHDAYSPQAPTRNMNFSNSTTLQEPYYQQPPQPRPPQNPSSSMRSPVTPISMAEEQQIEGDDHERRLSHSSNHSVPVFVQRRDNSAYIDDSLSPGRGHAFKRNEDAPRNPEGKMVCKYAECRHLTFERRCEWR